MNPLGDYDRSRMRPLFSWMAQNVAFKPFCGSFQIHPQRVVKKTLVYCVLSDGLAISIRHNVADVRTVVAVVRLGGSLQ